MRLAALALLSAWLAMPVAAQTVDALSRTEINTFTASNANRQLTLCLLADMQNTVSQDDFDGIGGVTGCPVTAGYCTGASCTSSPYCSGSWHNTGRILMQNLAYELTGQWEKIDYSAIDGSDNVQSKKPHPLDNGHCDAILSLGDMTDVPNDSGYGNYVASSAATLTSLGYDYQHETNKAFWGIIDKSGIPYVLAQGNHDPWVWWADLFTTFAIEGKSYFYDREDVYGLSYAALIPTRLGTPLCVESLAFSDSYIDPNNPSQTTRGADVLAWAISNVGCGGDYPTVLIGHAEITIGGGLSFAADGVRIVDITGIAGSPGATGTSEVFMAAGGHYIGVEGMTPSVKTSFTGRFGADADQTVYTFFSNWQEVNRHDTNDAQLGITASDGNGAAYTIVQIDANSSRICSHDWSPYWQTRNSRGNGQNHGEELMSSRCFDFDFDARYP